MAKAKIYKNKLLWIIAAALLIAIYILLSPQQSLDNSDLILESVKRGDLNMIVSASGSIEAPEEYSINARVSAKITDVYVKEGDIVLQGQELIRLSDADLQSAVKTATYSFNLAVYARDRLKNASIVDDYAVKQAQQQVNITWEQLQMAKRNLENAVIKSPVNGTVLSLNAKVSDYTSLTSMLPLLGISKEGDLEAVIEVNELDVSLVKLDQDIIFQVDAIGKELMGKVIYIAPKGTDLTGIVTYIVKASVPSEADLKPKMSIDGKINVYTSEDVLLISSLAVRDEDEKRFVYAPIYDSSKKIINVEKKYIETGMDNDSEVEVISGLSEGDEIILNYDLDSSSFNFGFGSTD